MILCLAHRRRYSKPYLLTTKMHGCASKVERFFFRIYIYCLFESFKSHMFNFMPTIYPTVPRLWRTIGTKSWHFCLRAHYYNAFLGQIYIPCRSSWRKIWHLTLVDILQEICTKNCTCSLSHGTAPSSHLEADCCNPRVDIWHSSQTRKLQYLCHRTYCTEALSDKFLCHVAYRNEICHGVHLR